MPGVAPARIVPFGDRSRVNPTFTLAIDHYELCPGHVQDKAIAQSGFKLKEDEE